MLAGKAVLQRNDHDTGASANIWVDGRVALKGEAVFVPCNLWAHLLAAAEEEAPQTGTFTTSTALMPLKHNMRSWLSKTSKKQKWPSKCLRSFQLERDVKSYKHSQRSPLAPLLHYITVMLHHTGRPFDPRAVWHLQGKDSSNYRCQSTARRPVGCWSFYTAPGSSRCMPWHSQWNIHLSTAHSALFNIKTVGQRAASSLHNTDGDCFSTRCLPFQTGPSAGLLRAPLDEKDIHTADTLKCTGYSEIEKSTSFSSLDIFFKQFVSVWHFYSPWNKPRLLGVHGQRHSGRRTDTDFLFCV